MDSNVKFYPGEQLPGPDLCLFSVKCFIAAPLVDTVQQTLKKTFFCELWQKKRVNYDKFKIATITKFFKLQQNRENQIFNPNTFFLPLERCYMILQCYLYIYTYIHILHHL